MNRLAVLGQPVAHSRSPAMQNAALEELGLAGEWSYEAIEVSPEDFAARVAAMPGEGFVGANVTVPHKEAALAAADDVSSEAFEIGAANTLSFGEGGIAAENTDAPGFLAALGSSPRGVRALVLGAGGAARAIVWALAGEGAEVRIWNRTAARAVELAEKFGVEAVEPADALDAVDRELIVNTTTVGMGDGGLAELSLVPGSLHAGQTVVDIAYGSGETELLAAARERGAATIDGAEMLARQGAESLRIWLERAYGPGEHEPPLEIMRAAAKAG